MAAAYWEIEGSITASRHGLFVNGARRLRGRLHRMSRAVKRLWILREWNGRAVHSEFSLCRAMIPE